MNKGDKLGIRAKTESVCLECLHLSIEAALSPKNRKLPITEKLSIAIEIIKQLIRLEREVGVVGEDFYISIQEKLQEISRMTNGWIVYLQKQEP